MSSQTHNPISGSLPGIDRARLEAVIEPVARAHGAEVVDLEFKSDATGWVLRVFVEKLGSADAGASTRDAAVDLELCAGVSRDLSPALDVADLIPHRYHLEVSSPGIERPLRTARDFQRFAGQKAKLRLSTAVGGQKVLRGLIGFERGVVTVDEDGRKFDVDLSAIERANLVFEFGPAPRPGGRKQKRK